VRSTFFPYFFPFAIAQHNFTTSIPPSPSHHVLVLRAPFAHSLATSFRQWRVTRAAIVVVSWFSQPLIFSHYCSDSTLSAHRRRMFQPTITTMLRSESSIPRCVSGVARARMVDLVPDVSHTQWPSENWFPTHTARQLKR
jgi:hypothetical protein